MNINERIREIRKYFCNDSNIVFAKALNEHPNATSNWCRSGYSVGRSVATRIAQKFGVDIGWLLTGSGEMLPKQPELGLMAKLDDAILQKYNTLNDEYIELSKELRESNKELRELHRILDEERKAKQVAEARISQLEMLLATQKKENYRPSASHGDATTLSPSNNR